MQLTTYLWKKLTGKLNCKKLKKDNESLLGDTSDSVFGNKWGELDRNVTIDKPIVCRNSKDGGGWTLIINNYTKCDVPSHIDWNMTFYEDTSNGDVYVRSQTKEEIYFLFWVVATLYSFETWIRLPKEFFNGDSTQAIKKIFEFTDHGASTGHGITMNSRVYIDKKNHPYYVQLGTMAHISGPGDNDSDIMLINF